MVGLDILCLSSAFDEGFLNVMGEAMAAGTPRAANDVGDCGYIVGGTSELAAPRGARCAFRCDGPIAETPGAAT